MSADPCRVVDVRRLRYSDEDVHYLPEVCDPLKPDDVGPLATGDGDYDTVSVYWVKRVRGPRAGTTACTFATYSGGAGRSGRTVRYRGKISLADAAAHYLCELRRATRD